MPPPPVASILAIQGGGFKGYFSALVLKDLATFKKDVGGGEAEAPLAQSFDLIAGTSAGAIFAAGLAAGVSPVDMVELMRAEGSEIFPSRRIATTWPGILRARFSAEKLRVVLGHILKKRMLGEVDVPLLIPAMNLTTGRPTLFRSWEPHHRRELLVDVVMASAAAPTYLPRHRIGDTYYADGGLVANGPALLAARDMARVFEVPIQRQRIVSVGTTFTSGSDSGWPDCAAWGLLGWVLPRPRLVDMLMDGQMKLQQEILFDLDPLALITLDQEVSGIDAKTIHLVRADSAAKCALEVAAERCIGAVAPEDRNTLSAIFGRRARRLGLLTEFGGERPCLVERP